jgi:multidrug efflux system membrane fusion protein
VLFVIDPTPYEIKLSHATAQLQTAEARLELASRQFARAEKLKGTGAGSGENAEQKTAELKAGRAAVDDAQSMVRDAQFDLDHCRITAPFTGRIGSHLVSIGNLISGSRAGNGPTTLLATLVSLDPIYLNFDMSESDYMAYLRGRANGKTVTDKADVSLSDEKIYARHGTLDFIDNALNRSSGTIRARATVPNSDLLLTPGAFARVRLPISPPSSVLLVPDAVVLPDQSQHIVLTIDSNDTVTPKVVTLGDLRGGLRVIQSGLEPTDRVIVEGIPTVRPGSKILPSAGSIHFESTQD